MLLSCFTRFCSKSGVSGNSRSRPFLGMKASDFHSQIMGMDFFIPFRFPNFGNAFFHPLPGPEFWDCFFSYPFRFQIVGKDFFAFPSRYQICYFTDRNNNRNWNIVRDNRLPRFQQKVTEEDWDIWMSYHVTHWLVAVIARRCLLLYLKKSLVVAETSIRETVMKGRNTSR